MSNDKKALGRETPSEPLCPSKESEELTILRVDNSRLTQELEGNKEVIHELRNLMAIMHHDGGHYTAKHGLINAIKDANQTGTKI